MHFDVTGLSMSPKTSVSSNLGVSGLMLPNHEQNQPFWRGDQFIYVTDKNVVSLLYKSLRNENMKRNMIFITSFKGIQ